MSKIKIEPDWVCKDCASERGAYIPVNHISTWHTGTCGICKQVKSVTQPRDYGKTRSLLLIDKK